MSMMTTRITTRLDSIVADYRNGNREARQMGQGAGR